MAKLDDYWNQVQQSESFQGLGDDEKEKVRNHLFEKYVQTSDSYIGLPQSQRLKVKKHFDDVTHIEPETMMGGIEKKAKKVGAAAGQMVDKAKAALPGIKEGASDLLESGKRDIEDISSTGEEIPGMKEAAAGAKDITERVAGAVEPNYVKPSLTAFDMARAVASGAVRTAGEFVNGMIPETTIGAAGWAVPFDAVARYAGLTFPTLAKERSFPWNPKTGLSPEAKTLGDDMEKLITQENINQHIRKNIGSMQTANAKPLEVLANEEEKVKAQSEVQRYEDHLKQLDDLSARGGEPQGDLYPAAKTNVTQLRDLAKARLQKLQDEPVRVESLSRAEDELQGYYRRKVDQARVFMMPEGPKTEPQAMLPAPEQPAGLLKAGEPPKKAPLEQPSIPAKTNATPSVPPPAAAPKAISYKASEVVSKMYQAYNPDQTIEANKIRAGALIKAMGMKPTEELSLEKMGMFEKILESEHATRLEKEVKRPISKEINVEKVKAKGLDPVEVKAEAQRLKVEHDNRISHINEERAKMKDVTGGIDSMIRTR